MNSSTNFDFEPAFSKLQSIQYRYELVHDAILALKSNNGAIEGLEQLIGLHQRLRSGDDRLKICKAQFKTMQTSAEDLLDRVKQVSILVSTPV